MINEIKDLINKLVSYVKFKLGKFLLHDTVKTQSKAYVTESIQRNVDLQGKAGLQPKIIRSSGGKCCPWCSDVEGTYNYPNVPRDVYRRHRGCTCSVDYFPGDGRRQNVHSKVWYEGESEKAKEKYEGWKENLENGLNDDIMYTGARIIDPDSNEGQRHAKLFYQEVKSYSTDCLKIANNTGYSIEIIKRIKQYLFYTKEFTPDCAIAQSWQRLMLGKDIKKHDLTLLKHVICEIEIKERNKGMDHWKAHQIASKKYDYNKEVSEYYDSPKKN